MKLVRERRMSAKERMKLVKKVKEIRQEWREKQKLKSALHLTLAKCLFNGFQSPTAIPINKCVMRTQ